MGYTKMHSQQREEGWQQSSLSEMEAAEAREELWLSHTTQADIVW